MSYSTITRIMGLGLLCLIIVFSGFVLFADHKAGIIEMTPPKTASTKDMAQPETISDDMTDMPVVKLASLSIVTDYPVKSDPYLNEGVGADIEDRLASARELSAVQKYEEALSALDVAPTSEQEHYSLNYMKAQILSWSGDFEKAEQAFTDLRQKYPQDADIAVSYGYLHLYQNNFEDAERLFTQILTRFPDYKDAQRGLNRAIAIK